MKSPCLSTLCKQLSAFLLWLLVCVITVGLIAWLVTNPQLQANNQTLLMNDVNGPFEIIGDGAYSGSNVNAAPVLADLGAYVTWLKGRGTVVDVDTNNLAADPSLLALQDGALSVVLARQNPSAVNQSFYCQAA